jgi:hypothetical protein
MKKVQVWRGACLCVVWLSLAVWLTSCSSPGPYAPKSELGGSSAQLSQRVLFLDETLRDAVLLVNSVQKRLPRGEILVQANFRSRLQKNDIWVDVKFEFYDADSMLVDETEWMKVHFPAMEVTMVQGSSIASNAAKHVILLNNS